MLTRTFRARNMLGLLESAQLELGPMAVFLSVRKIALTVDGKPGYYLEGTAMVDREAPGVAAPASIHEATPRLPAVEEESAPESVPPNGRRNSGPALRFVNYLRQKASQTQTTESPSAAINRETSDLQEPLIYDSLQQTPQKLGSENGVEFRDFRGRSAIEDIRAERKVVSFPASNPPAPVPAVGKVKACKALMLIGPEGAGKSSMAAKLAAYLHAQEKAPVGLISTDTRDQASLAQLRKITQALGIPFSPAGSASELLDLVRRWEGRGSLVIDTPAPNPGEMAILARMKETLLPLSADLETHLVLAADVQPEQCLELMKAYLPTRYEKLALTRVDRRTQARETLTRLILERVPISYLGIGSRIPEDLAVPDRADLQALMA